VDVNGVLDQLVRNARRIRALVEGVPDEQARSRPDPESWSILEVVCHLHDEEREDFRPRLDIMLHRPDDRWAPIDPRGWVTARRYNEQFLAEQLAGYVAEREASLAWLRGLEAPDWEATVTVPWGTMRAGDMLASWAAHDLLHLRQLVELHRAQVLALTDGYSTEYAGDW